MRKVPSISGYVKTRNNALNTITILDMSLISRLCKNDHIIFNVGTPSLEARNIRLVNIQRFHIRVHFHLGIHSFRNYIHGLRNHFHDLRNHFRVIVDMKI
jgi:hypothetical protein